MPKRKSRPQDDEVILEQLVVQQGKMIESLLTEIQSLRKDVHALKEEVIQELRGRPDASDSLKEFGKSMNWS